PPVRVRAAVLARRRCDASIAPGRGRGRPRPQPSGGVREHSRGGIRDLHLHAATLAPQRGGGAGLQPAGLLAPGAFQLDHRGPPILAAAHPWPPFRSVVTRSLEGRCDTLSVTIST